MALFEDGALRVSTGEHPDYDLTIQGLTALVYGHTIAGVSVVDVE